MDRAGDRVEGVVYQLGSDLILQFFDENDRKLGAFDHWEYGFEPFRFRAAAEQDDILELASQYMSTFSQQVPGAVVAVMRNGKVVFQSARGRASLSRSERWILIRFFRLRS